MSHGEREAVPVGEVRGHERHVEVDVRELVVILHEGLERGHVERVGLEGRLHHGAVLHLELRVHGVVLVGALALVRALGDHPGRELVGEGVLGLLGRVDHDRVVLREARSLGRAGDDGADGGHPRRDGDGGHRDAEPEGEPQPHAAGDPRESGTSRQRLVGTLAPRFLHAIPHVHRDLRIVSGVLGARTVARRGPDSEQEGAPLARRTDERRLLACERSDDDVT